MEEIPAPQPVKTISRLGLQVLRFFPQLVEATAMPQESQRALFTKICVLHQQRQPQTLLLAWVLGTQGPRGKGRDPGRLAWTSCWPPYLRRKLSEEILLGEGKSGPPNQEGASERAARSRPLRAEVS